MSAHELVRQFERMGARLQLRELNHRRNSSAVAIDIRRDAIGEYFDVAANTEKSRELIVVDVQPRMRHLLLLSREDDGKHKFLCGHDERHWFVAAVPETEPAATVQTAMTALKPTRIRELESRLGVKSRKRNRRRNEAFVRQGEWFFVPVGSVPPSTMPPLRNEALRRGRGKSHICEWLIRSGGEGVYTCSRYPNGLTEEQQASLIRRHPEARFWGWNYQRRNPSVFVRGTVRHPDHKTIRLADWHEVLMNTETQAVAMRNVAFID